MQEKKGEKSRIIITFESRRACLAKVDFENMDRETIAPQLVMIGEFLAYKGREMWAEKATTIPSSMIMPPGGMPPGFFRG